MSDNPGRRCILCGQPATEGHPPLCAEHRALIPDADPIAPAETERTCLLCDQPQDLASARPYCATHYAQYQARQAAGVRASELDSQWGDYLSTWRDRPSELASEPFAARLRLRREWHGWLFFTMGYPSRLPDWLVVERTTGTVRRYVEVSETDVRAALLGLPAQHQTNLAGRWGRPEGSTRPPLMSFQEHLAGLHAPDAKTRHAAWLKDLEEADLPVYAPVGAPFGLLLQSTARGGERSNRSLTLIFAYRPASAEAGARTEEQLIPVRQRMMAEQWTARERATRQRGGTYKSGSFQLGRAPALPRAYPPLPTRLLELRYSYEVLAGDNPESAQTQTQFRMDWDAFAINLYQGLPEPARAALSAPVAQTLCLAVHHILWRIAPDLVAAIAASPVEAHMIPIRLVGTEFRGEVLSWAHQPPLSAFRLVRAEGPHVNYLIIGAAWGLAWPALRTLLSEMVRVDNDPAHLAQYVAELDAQMQRYHPLA